MSFDHMINVCRFLKDKINERKSIIREGSESKESRDEETSLLLAEKMVSKADIKAKEAETEKALEFLGFTWGILWSLNIFKADEICSFIEENTLKNIMNKTLAA